MRPTATGFIARSDQFTAEELQLIANLIDAGVEKYCRTLEDVRAVNNIMVRRNEALESLQPPQ